MDNKSKLALVSAALLGSAVGAVAVALSDTETEQKLAEGFEGVKSEAMKRVEAIKAKLKDSTGKTKEVLIQEIERAQLELEKAKKMLEEKEVA